MSAGVRCVGADACAHITTHERSNMSDQTPPDNRSEIVALQLGLHKDLGDQTVQSRFQEFCDEAVGRLTQTDANGEPIFEAGKAKASFTVTVELERMADDAFAFSSAATCKQKLPSPPPRARTAMLVRGLGLAQKVTDARQAGLFNPADGQPEPMSQEEAEEKLGD
jgi:hypothetical protein